MVPEHEVAQHVHYVGVIFDVEFAQVFQDSHLFTDERGEALVVADNLYKEYLK